MLLDININNFFQPFDKFKVFIEHCPIEEKLFFVLQPNAIHDNPFPNGLRITNNQFAFKHTYKESKKQNILKSAIQVQNEIIDIFKDVEKLMFQDNIDNNDMVLEYWYLDDNTQKMKVYCRFCGCDMERLGFSHGIMIPKSFEEKNEEFKQFKLDLKYFFYNILN